MNKAILITILGILLFSCKQKAEPKKDAKQPEIQTKTENINFDWLVGEWKRNNEEQGKVTFENWEKISATEYAGIGFTMKDRDTIKQEKIKIVETNGKWSLTVKVPEEKKSISFKMSELSKEKFAVVNDSLDFPNRIEYWKNGEKINALVSGGEMEIPFEFERLK